MPNLTYETGTVTVSPGDTVISGVGMIWSAPNARPFDRINIAGVEVTVIDFPTTLSATIEPWPGEEVLNQPYKLFQVSPLRFTNAAIAESTNRIVAALDKDGFYIFVGQNETEPDPSLGDDGQYARQPSTGKEWLKLDGDWVYQGVFGNFTFIETPWAAPTTYAVRVVLPFAGRLWVSLQGNNIGHRPDLSPLWWSEFLSGGDAYDVVTFDTDRPASDELVLKLVMTKSVTFFAGLTDSRAHAETGATLAAVYRLKKNGSQFGTMQFAAGGQAGPQTATFTAVADTTFAPGDILTITAPVTRDATLSGISGTLSGYRN